MLTLGYAHVRVFCWPKLCQTGRDFVKSTWTRVRKIEFLGRRFSPGLTLIINTRYCRIDINQDIERLGVRFSKTY